MAACVLKFYKFLSCFIHITKPIYSVIERSIGSQYLEELYSKTSGENKIMLLAKFHRGYVLAV